MPRDTARKRLQAMLWGNESETVVVAPVHLSGCQNIADVFQVSRPTVRQWVEAGAPIARIGGRLVAEYNALMHWHTRRAQKGL